MLWGLLAAGSGVWGQGVFDPTVLNTIPGQALTGEAVSLSFGNGVLNPALRVKLGFATDEASGPGIFSDAYTVTLQSEDGVVTLVLATFDAAGVVWAPPTPSTTPISEESIGRQLIGYPDLTPVLANPQAYQVEVALPNEVLGRPLTMYFDLFSNDNGVASQAWFSELTLVPEPSAVTLLAMGAVGWWWYRRRQR